MSTTKRAEKPAGGWSPAVELDLVTASNAAFQDAIKRLKEWADDQGELGPLPLNTGWYDVDPQLAEGLLCRTIGNRKVSLATVKKYYYAMATGDWRKTGQGILVNEHGQMLDARHRCLASYLGKVSFPTLIVTDVPAQDDLFAYIDDCKARSQSDALYTAGMNGISGTVAAAIKVAWRYDNNALAVMRNVALEREISIREGLEYARNNPLLGTTAHLVMANHGEAMNIIGNAGVGAFFCWKVADRFSADTLEDFLIDLADQELEDDDNAIVALRKRLLVVKKDPNTPLTKPLLLALMIKAFDYWITRADKKLFAGRHGLHVRDNEPFPRFERIQVPAAQAAE